MQKACCRLFFVIALIIISGCSYFRFPGVYKIEIQQGNIITQEMVDQLKPGMTKRQVRFILGTPLIADTFNQDRWDYLYRLEDARDNVEQERISVFFTNDTLTHIGGDFAPNLGIDDNADSD